MSKVRRDDGGSKTVRKMKEPLQARITEMKTLEVGTKDYGRVKTKKEFRKSSVIWSSLEKKKIKEIVNK